MVDYRQWLATMRAEAAARGGKALNKSQLAAAGKEYRAWRQWQEPSELDKRLRIVGRRQGEIANPVTGEVVTGTLSIGRLAKQLGLSTVALSERMESLKLVCRVLAFKEVRAVCQPDFIEPYTRRPSKPVYFHTIAATQCGVEEGYIIPIKVHHNGELKVMLLVTPDGQRLLRKTITSDHPPPISRAERLSAKRMEIAQLLQQGHSQVDIRRITGLPKQTVSRHVLALRGSESHERSSSVYRA